MIAPIIHVAPIIHEFTVSNQDCRRGARRMGWEGTPSARLGMFRARRLHVSTEVLIRAGCAMGGAYPRSLRKGELKSEVTLVTFGRLSQPFIVETCPIEI